jgi:hypothetical protein
VDLERLDALRRTEAKHATLEASDTS